MNRSLPPRDRAIEAELLAGNPDVAGLCPGAVGLVGGTADSRKRSAADQMNEARRTLESSLRTILRGNRDNELNQLLLEMCEANQLEICEQEEIRCWRPAKDNDFTTRWFAIQNETQAAIADLFFSGLVIFSVDEYPMAVRWRCKTTQVVN